MIIRRLKLQNYRRFRELELEFPENIIGILGRNGSGKTTLVEAIGWCLYGNRIKRTDKQDIRSQFCSSADITSVMVEFVLQGENYRIQRELRGKNASIQAAIYRGDSPDPIAVQERGVNEMVEKLLNLDYRSFFISVFARQKDLAALSMFQPEERRKSIARLINIDAIEKARKEVRSDRKTKAETKIGMEAHLSDEQDLKKKKQQLQEKLRALQKDLAKKEKLFGSSKEELKNIKSEFETLSQKREQFLAISARMENKKKLKSEFETRSLQLQKDLNQILEAKKEYDSQKTKLNEFARIERRKEKLEKESNKFASLQAYKDEEKRIKNQIDRERVKLTKFIEDLKSAHQIEEQLAKIDEYISEVEKSLQIFRQKKLTSQGQLTSIRDKGKETRLKRDKILELGPQSPCPICTRPLKDHYDNVLSQFETELQSLRNQYLEIEKSDKELESKIREKERELKELQSRREVQLRVQEQHRQLQKQKDESENELKRLNEDLEKVYKRMADLGKVDYDVKLHEKIKKQYKELYAIRDRLLRHEENIKRLDQVKNDLDNVKKAITGFEEELKQLEQKLIELNFNDENYQQAKVRLEQKQQNLDKIKDEINQLRQEQIAVKKDIEHLQSEIEKNKKIRSEIAAMKEEIAYLDALDYHFGIFRQELSGRVRPMIAARASELLNLTTEGKYSILELDEDYNIFLFDQTERFPLARFSGGEQDLANLCLRIAISQVVAERAGRSQINFIVLDEIFGSQDEQRRELIMTALQKLATQFRQIFIITHVENIKESLPIVIHVKEKSALESEAILF